MNVCGEIRGELDPVSHFSRLKSSIIVILVNLNGVIVPVSHVGPNKTCCIAPFSLFGKLFMEL